MYLKTDNNNIVAISKTGMIISCIEADNAMYLKTDNNNIVAISKNI